MIRAREGAERFRGKEERETGWDYWGEKWARLRSRWCFICNSAKPGEAEGRANETRIRSVSLTTAFLGTGHGSGVWSSAPIWMLQVVDGDGDGDGGGADADADNDDTNNDSH